MDLHSAEKEPVRWDDVEGGEEDVWIAERIAEGLGSVEASATLALTSPGNFRSSSPSRLNQEKARVHEEDPLALGGYIPSRRIPGKNIYPSDAGFSPSEFMKEVHGETPLPDLYVGLEHLEEKLKEEPEELRKHVIANVDEYMRCKEIAGQFRRDCCDEDTEDYIGLFQASGADKLLEQYESIFRSADKLYAPLFTRSDRVVLLKRILRILQQYQFVFYLPTNLKEAIREEDYDRVVREYKKTQAFVQKTDIDLFRRVLSAVDGIMIQFRDQLTTFLKTDEVSLVSWIAGKHTHSLENQLRAIKYLIEIGTSGENPAVLFLDSQLNMLKRLCTHFRNNFGVLSRVDDRDRDTVSLEVKQACNGCRSFTRSVSRVLQTIWPVLKKIRDAEWHLKVEDGPPLQELVDGIRQRILDVFEGTVVRAAEKLMKVDVTDTIVGKDTAYNEYRHGNRLYSLVVLSEFRRDWLRICIRLCKDEQYKVPESFWAPLTKIGSRMTALYVEQLHMQTQLRMAMTLGSADWKLTSHEFSRKKTSKSGAVEFVSYVLKVTRKPDLARELMEQSIESMKRLKSDGVIRDSLLDLVRGILQVIPKCIYKHAFSSSSSAIDERQLLHWMSDIMYIQQKVIPTLYPLIINALQSASVEEPVGENARDGNFGTTIDRVMEERTQAVQKVFSEIDRDLIGVLERTKTVYVSKKSSRVLAIIREGLLHSGVYWKDDEAEKQHVSIVVESPDTSGADVGLPPHLQGILSALSKESSDSLLRPYVMKVLLEAVVIHSELVSHCPTMVDTILKKIVVNALQTLTDTVRSLPVARIGARAAYVTQLEVSLLHESLERFIHIPSVSKAYKRLHQCVNAKLNLAFGGSSSAMQFAETSIGTTVKDVVFRNRTLLDCLTTKPS